MRGEQQMRGRRVQQMRRAADEGEGEQQMRGSSR